MVNWPTVWLVLTLSLLNDFKTWQVDFVQAFMQASLDCPIYMKVPAGFSVIADKLCFTGEATHNTKKCYVLKLIKTMYSPKQAGHNWYKHLHDELTSAGFH